MVRVTFTCHVPTATGEGRMDIRAALVHTPVRFAALALDHTSEPTGYVARVTRRYRHYLGAQKEQAKATFPPASCVTPGRTGAAPPGCS